MCYFVEVVEPDKEVARPRRTWKEVVVKDVNDLHMKPSDATEENDEGIRATEELTSDVES